MRPLISFVSRYRRGQPSPRRTTTWVGPFSRRATSRQIQKLCQAALELEENQWVAFREEACGGDEELRREVESLLRFDKRGGRFIKQPALDVAAKMIAHEKPESWLGQQAGH